MQQILTKDQVLVMLNGMEELLKMIQANPGYRNLEGSSEFDTSNDLVLGDAIQALFEIQTAIVNLEI